MTTEMGQLIDELVKDPKTVKIADNVIDRIENERADISYLDTKDQELYIQSVSEDGKILWKLIEAVTKHLPVNKDGTDTLLEIKTGSGKVVKATKAKSFLTRINNKIVPIRGDELKIGIMIPVVKSPTNENYSDKIPGNNIGNMNGVVSKNELRKLLDNNNNLSEQEIEIINHALNSDVHYDEITEIKEVKPLKQYVYDLTVADTKTFCLLNGLCMMDSFHHTGIAANTLHLLLLLRF